MFSHSPGWPLAARPWFWVFSLAGAFMALYFCWPTFLRAAKTSKPRFKSRTQSLLWPICKPSAINSCFTVKKFLSPTPNIRSYKRMSCFEIESPQDLASRHTPLFTPTWWIYPPGAVWRSSRDVLHLCVHEEHQGRAQVLRRLYIDTWRVHLS